MHGMSSLPRVPEPSDVLSTRLHRFVEPLNVFSRATLARIKLGEIFKRCSGPRLFLVQNAYPDVPMLVTRTWFRANECRWLKQVNADEASLLGADAKPLNLGPNPEAGPSDGGVYVDPALVAARSSLCRFVPTCNRCDEALELV